MAITLDHRLVKLAAAGTITLQLSACGFLTAPIGLAGAEIASSSAQVVDYGLRQGKNAAGYGLSQGQQAANLVRRRVGLGVGESYSVAADDVTAAAAESVDSPARLAVQ